MADPRLSRQFRARVAAHQGVFTRRDAIEHGISDIALSLGIAHGMWRRYHVIGIYLMGGFPDSTRSRLRAHLMRAGHRALATGPSALEIYGLDLAGAPGKPFRVGDGLSFLSIPRNRHLSIDGTVLLRDQLRTSATWIADFPLVARKRAVVDALRVLALDEARAVLHRSLQRRWITGDDLDHAVERLHKHRGLPQLRNLAQEARSGSHAESERVLHRLLRTNQIPDWQANIEVFDDAGMIGIVDVGFESERLTVEVDGRAWHSTAERFQRDRERQNRLVNSGWTVLRFTWEDLTERPAHVVATIRRALSR